MEAPLSASFSTARDATPDVLPASHFLQERLQHRRARNTRPVRSRQSDFGPRRAPDDDIFFNEAEASTYTSSRPFDSSPLAMGPRRVADVGDASKKRGLGAKGIDEHMDRLTKENFALKLELDHRREHTAKLQEKIEAMRAQVARMEQLQEEHTELLRINSQLVEELEKRDKAVEEAMDIICDLEDRVNEMEERNSITRPSTANADSGYAGTETHEQAPAASPPELSKPPKTPNAARDPPPAAASAATTRLLSAVNGKTPMRPRREPSVLSQKKQSTHALRSVYLEATQSLHPVKSFNSLLTRQEENNEEDETPSSPRLSVLSESSFPSMYSPKKGHSPDRFAWEAEDEEPIATAHRPSPHLRQDSIKRVSQWMSERDFSDQTPSKSNSLTLPLLVESQETTSSVAPQRLVANGRYTPIASIDANTVNAIALDAPESVQYIKPFPMRPRPNLSKTPRPTSFGGAMFGEPLLPPTPESASTRMLRASNSSIGDEKSLLDSTPHVVRGFDTLEPGIRTAPKQMRSSVELNSAYQSYVQHSDTLAHGHDEDDAVSDTIRDLGVDYGEFPDGGSIQMGTPSRFLKHARPFATVAPHDGYDLSPTTSRQPPFARRQSSSEATIGQRRPSLSRAETSPILSRGQVGITSSTLPSSSATLTSPRSYHSGSSSNRTIMMSEERMHSLSPELSRNGARSATAAGSPPRPRASPSPARRLSQKAHGFIRRMSNTQREMLLEREKSPLPTLTTAPSSSFVNAIPKEARRPGTSYSGGEGAVQPAWSTPRAVESSRPGMQPRMNTTPTVPPRRLSAGVSERRSLETERKNLFRRSASAKRGGEMAAAQDSNSTGHEGSGMRGMITRRRDSIKDAVASAARRPWR